MNFLTTEHCALILLVAAFLTHGLLLFNDGWYWDGWILNGWQQTKDWASMRRFFGDVGMTPLYFQHRLMAGLPCRLFMYKLLGFGALYLSAFCVYLLAVQFGSLTSFEALGVALVMLCYPGQQMQVEPVISLNYLLPVAAFFGASWLGLSGEVALGYAHWLFRVGALLLFAISFNMNSLVMCYGGFALFSFSFHLSTQGFGLQSGGWFLMTHIDYLVLPALYWWGKEEFTPRRGQYATYNRLKISWEKTGAGLCQAWNLGVIGTAGDALRQLRGRRIARWVVGFLGISAFLLVRELPLMSAIKASGVLLFGIMLFVLATVPYIWVGQQFLRRGWGTKNIILLALPFALLTVGALNFALNPGFLVLALSVLISTSVLYLHHIYLCWLAVWAKNRSFLLNLGRIPEAKNLSIVGMTDEHPIRGSFNDGHPEHGAVYLTYMLTYLYGDVTRLGIYEQRPRSRHYTAEEISAAIRATTLEYGLTKIDPRGPQAMVTIKAGSQRYSEMETGWKYLCYRFFNRRKLDGFLAELTQIEYQPLVDPLSAAAKQATFDALIDQAKQHVDNGRWSEAMVLLLEGVALNPSQVDLYSSVGFCLVNLNRESEGVAYFQKAMEMQPNAENAQALGIACTMSSQWTEAEHSFQQVMSFVPNDLDASRSLGELYLSQGRFDAATEILERTIVHHAHDTASLLLLADVNHRKGDPAKARDYYRDVLVLDASNVHATQSLERLASSRG